MIQAAKRASQMALHMAIASALAYALTGSIVFSGLAAIAEPAINVALLPAHERAWRRARDRAEDAMARALSLAGEKLSQTAMHAVVAFSVMWAATGSLAAGGLAALIEPACNTLALPLHDRFWDWMSGASERGLLARSA